MAQQATSRITVNRLFEDKYGHVRWEEFHSIKEASRELHLATEGLDKANLKDLEMNLRQSIYAYQRAEWELNGRWLSRIKLGKGKDYPVKYGYTRKSHLLVNDRVRAKRLIEPRVKDYLEKTHGIENRLSESQINDTVLHLVKDPLIQLDRKVAGE